jgi:hypothetical protein
MPVLKHHSSTHLSIAMKNLMVCQNRMNTLTALISVLPISVYTKARLNIVDAYRVLMSDGPTAA